MRAGDEEKHPSAIAREKKQGSAKLRAVGSYVLGGIATAKLMLPELLDRPPLEGADLVTWLAVFTFAFGLASVDQILKALGKG